MRFINHLRARKTGGQGFNVPLTDREIMARIEYSLKDIRETLRLYPDPSHPYVQEKLEERDNFLTQWTTVNKRLQRARTPAYDVERGVDIDWPPIGPRF